MAAGKWDGGLLQAGALVAGLFDKNGPPVNPYRPPSKPRVKTAAEEEHDNRKAWRLFDTWMSQTFEGG